jgi:uncharacterized membrane protein HdeD (DUF308 family)
MAVANPPVSTVNDNPISPWWVTLLSGIALLFIGIMLWTRPALTTLIIVQVMGWFFLFEGILNIIMIFVDRRGWGWNLFMGIIGIIAGLWIVNNPVAGSVATLVAIVIVLGVQALLFGAVSLVASFQGAGIGAAILGIVSIILGGLLLFTNPVLTAAAVPWVYGVFAVVGGIATIAGAFAQRSRQKKVVTA